MNEQKKNVVSATVCSDSEDLFITQLVRRRASVNTRSFHLNTYFAKYKNNKATIKCFRRGANGLSLSCIFKITPLLFCYFEQHIKYLNAREFAAQWTAFPTWKLEHRSQGWAGGSVGGWFWGGGWQVSLSAYNFLVWLNYSGWSPPRNNNPRQMGRSPLKAS